MSKTSQPISVHIIESLFSSDRKVRTAEGPALAEALRLHRIGVTSHEKITDPLIESSCAAIRAARDARIDRS